MALIDRERRVRGASPPIEAKAAETVLVADDEPGVRMLVAEVIRGDQPGRRKLPIANVHSRQTT